MLITLTTKLKLITTPEQYKALRATQLAYRDALNLVSGYAFEHGKTSNRRRLQRALYGQVRSQHTLPAQMTCSVFRQVGATYKGLWTKARKNAEARRLGYTKKHFRGLDKAPHYVSPTLSYVYGRDYSLRSDQQVSLLTLCGRIHVSYQGYSKHVTLLQQGARLGGAKLWYDRYKKRFYLLVAVEIETPNPTPEVLGPVLGVDVGQRYLATVTTTTDDTQFFCGKEVRQQADHCARLQRRVQQKGTRSATRHKIALALRERRLKLNTNHTISKQIVATHPQVFIGVEDLTHIRERTWRRKKRRNGKQMVPVSAKAKKANRHASQWAFAELQRLLAYKAALADSICVKVDADYTSQSCPRCGCTSKANRKGRGLQFVCRQCRYTLHADLVGARNIALRALVIRQDWMATGQLSDAPDVTDREAKAARLARYAELRWSLVTSSSSVQGIESLINWIPLSLTPPLPRAYSAKKRTDI
jgi:putative transposase